MCFLFESQSYTVDASSLSCCLGPSGLWSGVLSPDLSLSMVDTQTCRIRSRPPLHHSRTCRRCSRRCICQNRCSSAATTFWSCHGFSSSAVGQTKKKEKCRPAITLTFSWVEQRRKTHLRGLDVRLTTITLTLPVYGPFGSVVVGVVAVRTGAAGGGMMLRMDKRNKQYGLKITDIQYCNFSTIEDTKFKKKIKIFT